MTRRGFLRFIGVAPAGLPVALAARPSTDIRAALMTPAEAAALAAGIDISSKDWTSRDAQIIVSRSFPVHEICPLLSVERRQVHLLDRQPPVSS